MAKTATAKKSGKAAPKAKVDPLKTVTSIHQLAQTALDETTQFAEKGTKAAGKRARAALQEMKKLAANARKEIQAVVNASK